MPVVNTIVNASEIEKTTPAGQVGLLNTSFFLADLMSSLGPFSRSKVCKALGEFLLALASLIYESLHQDFYKYSIVGSMLGFNLFLS